jgi:hypothetical protein
VKWVAVAESGMIAFESNVAANTGGVEDSVVVALDGTQATVRGNSSMRYAKLLGIGVVS